MAFKYWAQRLTSAGLACLLASAAESQAFGRFGYVKQIAVPGFVVAGDGFRMNLPAAELIKFETPSRVWSCQSISAHGETVVLSGIGRSPAKLKADLWAPGFALYVQHGLALKLTGPLSPYLSWTEGSVGPDVPTPRCKWILVSFQDGRPPVLLAFVGGSEALRVVGKPGEWTVQTESPFVGWVRVVAPAGLVAHPAGTAQALGRLVASVSHDADRWSEPAPQLQSLAVEDGPTAVTATWSFDKPGAIVPVAATLAELGGYRATIESKTERIDAPNECGPVTVCSEPRLVVRFPIRRLPTGRSLPLGEPIGEATSTAPAAGVAAVAELALRNLQAARDPAARSSAEDGLSSYLTEADYVSEPLTGQRLPFAADGRGADLAAAYAMLMQVLYSTVSATSEPNALLTSLTWRRDEYTWEFWAGDSESGRRTAALAALAGALCPEPSRRLEAAMFEAGLAARRGLNVWRRRRGDLAKEPALIEPLESVRNAFFASGLPGAGEDPFVRSLFSDVRVYGEQAVVLTSLPVGGYRIAWTAFDARPTVLTFASAYPLDITPRSVFDKFSASQALGFTILNCTPKSAGPCEALLRIPSWASALPPAAPPPRYSETAR